MIRFLWLAVLLCVSTSAFAQCEQGGDQYMGEESYVVANTYGGSGVTMQIVNVAGGERTRGYITADVFGVQRSIPVINGQLPAIGQNGNNLLLDYGHNYVYNITYKSGVKYAVGAATVVANDDSPSAVKGFGQDKIPSKVPLKSETSNDASALKRPGDAQKSEIKDGDKPQRPSDEEIESLLNKDQ